MKNRGRLLLMVVFLSAFTGSHCCIPGSGSNTQATPAPEGNTVSDSELQQLTEELLTRDIGLEPISLNLQGKASSASDQDNARDPLIESVPRAVLERETVKLMKKLLDNYLPQVHDEEDRTTAERQEEQNFLTALMNTQVMQTTEIFLKHKNLISGNLRDKLETMWFTQYSRKGQHLGSSGFEHVFVGEMKDSKVSGFHNWLNFLKEEERKALNYKGYMKIMELNGKGKILKVRFDWLDHAKPVGSLFMGTTPELDMALYTICSLARPESSCPVQLAGNQFNIHTWNYNADGVTVIGSAYPDI